MQEKVNNLIKTACEVISGICGEEIEPTTLFAKKESNVKRCISTTRQICLYVMHRDLGYSVTFIARKTNTTRTSVFKNVKKATDLMSVDKSYQEMYKQVKDKIMQ